MRPTKVLLLICAVTLAIAAATQGEDWAQFRGPNGAGLVEGIKLPAEWGKEKNVAWRVEVPGVAWSCPIVWGDKVFVTTAISENQTKPTAGGGGFGGGFGRGGGRRGGPGGDKGGEPKDYKDEAPKGEKQAEEPKSDDADKGKKRGGFGGKGGFGKGGFKGGKGGFGFGGGEPPDAVYRWEVHCLDRRTGETIWKALAHEGKPTIATHQTNTYASETPVTDGERVYAYFGMHGLYCFDLEGKPVWKKDIGSYKMMFGWGTGSSPVLIGDRLFLQCDNEDQSFLVAFDKKTGEEIWRKEREKGSSWSTPFVWQTSNGPQLVATGGNCVRSYRPEDGELIWELNGVNGQSSASPIAADGLLYVGAGGAMGASPLFAVKETAKGDITLDGESSNDHVAWSRDRAGPTMASLLAYQGYVYVFDQRGGMVNCYDGKSGEPAYTKKRIDGARGFTSSPWAADGKVYCLDDEGRTTVLKAGPEFEILGQYEIGEMCWSSPAFVDDSVLLRTVDALYCFRQAE